MSDTAKARPSPQEEDEEEEDEIIRHPQLRDDVFNEAANLVQQMEPLQRVVINKWGFVMYRCTYASDEDWKKFLKILNRRARYDLRMYSYAELFETLEWTVQSDPETLDGASKDFVRERFKEWVEEEAARLQVRYKYEMTARTSPRFQFCMHVDGDALQSVVRDAPQPPKHDLKAIGYVNLIEADWNEELAKEDDGEEEIEGKDMYNVGWMKVAVDGLAPGTYQRISGGGGPFGDCYVRPPKIARP